MPAAPWIPPVTAAAADAVTTVTSSTPSTPAASTITGVSPLSAAAMESVKRRGLQLTSEFQQFVSAISRKESPAVSIPLELKLLAALLLLFLFLLFLIAVLWDRYGKEIGELYTPASAVGGGGDLSESNPNDVADEYTVYQKLPTFFYEYMPKKRN